MPDTSTTDSPCGEMVARYSVRPSALSEKPWLMTPIAPANSTRGCRGSATSMAVMTPGAPPVAQYVRPSGENPPSCPSAFAGTVSTVLLTLFSSRGCPQSRTSYTSKKAVPSMGPTSTPASRCRRSLTRSDSQVSPSIAGLVRCAVIRGWRGSAASTTCTPGWALAAAVMACGR